MPIQINRFLLFILFLFIFGELLAFSPKENTLKQSCISQEIILESNGFNAKKRSQFKFGEISEQINRGLTIIHFQTTEQFEFKTFDTHSYPEQAIKMVELLATMKKNNAKYALLAHDSAAKNLVSVKEKLSALGFQQLSELKNRQAFIAHNLWGNIVEKTDDLSISVSVQIPEKIEDAQIYFPKIKYDFEPHNDRYIAHAGGEINGVKSTNSKQALDANYKKGFRLFELDIIETSDGKMVAAHDWKMWARFTDYTGALPPSHAEFKKHKIYGDYSTLDMEGINHWFAKHPDATLVTDKVNDPIAFAEAFVDKNRLMMELFSLMSIEEASNNNINIIVSQKPLMAIKGDKIDYLKVNNVRHVAVSRRIIASNTELMLQLKKQGIRVYVFNVNFDSGKDEKYVQDNEIGLVYGMYADKWVFDTKKPTVSK